MYSINVFLTFSLSNLGMLRFWWAHRAEHADWVRHSVAHLVALVLCVSILGITIYEKFADGGWVTLLATASLVAACLWIRAHYDGIGAVLRKLDASVPSPPGVGATLREIELANDPADFHQDDIEGLEEHCATGEAPHPGRPVAVLFVGGYSGLGRHAVLALRHMFPGHFDGVVFVTIAVVDSESFKGADRIAALEERTRADLLRYERYASARGFHTASAFKVGTEVPETAEALARDLMERYPRALFVGGQLLFETDSWWNRLLHNETALIVQRRLQRAGFPMIVLPIRVDLDRQQPVLPPNLDVGPSVRVRRR